MLYGCSIACRGQWLVTTTFSLVRVLAMAIPAMGEQQAKNQPNPFSFPGKGTSKNIDKCQSRKCWSDWSLNCNRSALKTIISLLWASRHIRRVLGAYYHCIRVCRACLTSYRVPPNSSILCRGHSKPPSKKRIKLRRDQNTKWILSEKKWQHNTRPW